MAFANSRCLFVSLLMFISCLLHGCSRAASDVLTHTPEEVIRAQGISGLNSSELDSNVSLYSEGSWLHELKKDTRFLSSLASESDSKTTFFAGQRKQAAGDYAGAMEDYSSAFLADPNFTCALIFRGCMKAILDNHVDAEKDFAAAVRTGSQHSSSEVVALAWHFRGIAKHDLGDYTSAIEFSSEALRLHPQSPLAKVDWYNRANSKQELGNYKAAIEDYSEAVRLDPSFKRAWQNRGNAKQNLFDYAGAIEDYSVVLRLDPQFKRALTCRAVAKLELGDFKGAADDMWANVAMKGLPFVDSGEMSEAMAKLVFEVTFRGQAQELVRKERELLKGKTQRSAPGTKEF